MSENPDEMNVAKIQRQITLDMAQFIYDPLGHVMYSYRWGVGDLAGQSGPDIWQRETLLQIGEEAKKRQFNPILAKPVMPVLMAIASGHGIGKSALTAWIVNWIMDTRPQSRGTITANTAPQLEGKTWAEIAKWRKRSIMSFAYKVSTGKGNMKMVRVGYEESWFCKAETCREENSESFAGQHAVNGSSFYIFDEASAVPDKIWEVAEGGLTDGEPFWFVFGNPTRNTGRFHACFHSLRHRWIHRQIDSRNAKMTNKELIAQWIADHGENSDFVKVRVRGMFPSMALRQFISTELLDEARGKHLRPEQYNFAPKIITCDPAWEGDDELVIAYRQGLHFKVLKVLDKNDDDVYIANLIARYEDELGADAVNIDFGYGTGIKSAGKAMGRDWHLVNFGGKSPAADCLNMRAYMIVKAREWLKEGGAIPDDDQLYNEAHAIETVPRLDGKYQFEKKSDLKKRTGFSPNRFDSLILSFAREVTKKTWVPASGSANMYQTDYDPYK